jgi:hypothetical protein
MLIGKLEAAFNRGFCGQLENALAENEPPDLCALAHGSHIYA